MTRFLISFDARAMDHIPHEDMPAVSEAAHAVVREAMDAGAWVFGGGLENQKPSIVAMTERPRTARTPGRRRTLRRRRILTRGGAEVGCQDRGRLQLCSRGPRVHARSGRREL